MDQLRQLLVGAGICSPLEKAIAHLHSAMCSGHCTILGRRQASMLSGAFVLKRCGARVPEDLIGLWLGHARRTVTDLYAAGLQHDEAWRREWCERVGLGFGLPWATNPPQVELTQAA
jgi:hypothetical protein